ncbi:MAG: hypothetical protein AB3N11_02060, partial [Arenibacterium sp.]
MLKLSLIAGLSAVFLAQAPSIAVAQASAAAGHAPTEARGGVVWGFGPLVSAGYLPRGLFRGPFSPPTQTTSGHTPGISSTVPAHPTALL